MQFDEEYQRLNAEQRAAVDTIDGPLLVVAGPGTGKTQLLSMRVANILRQTDTDPSSILCLTFTNKAAVNMRQRIIALTGGEARGVFVKTFHSFAAEVMNMYPDNFWNGARLTSGPDVVQIEIIQNILGRLPLDNPLALTFAGNFTAGRDVQNGLKLAKEAGLTPEKLRVLIQANQAYIDTVESQLVDIVARPLSYKRLDELKTQVEALPEQGISVSLQPLLDLGSVIKDAFSFAYLQDTQTNKTTHTGAWKKRFIQTIDGQKGMFKERERNAWWLALADVYESYRDELHKRGYYDYSDMVVEVITQLQNQPAMRADVQERFLYVLIDEFQDTNAAQLQLAHLVADHHAAGGNPNIMAVGDDDQSIYKFNGAELNNMLSFKTSYPATKLVVLQENYRSTQAVLDTAEQIIGTVNDRLVNREPSLSKQLHANYAPPQPGTIAGLEYPNQAFELSDVAKRIAKDYAAGNTSIAVLARGHESLRRLSALLHAAQVPIHYEQQNNILTHPVVVQIYTLAALLGAIHDGNQERVNELLSISLRSPMWNIAPKKLWQLAITNRSKPNWLDSMQQSGDELANIAKWLLWLAAESVNQPLAITIEHIIGLRAGEHLTSPLRAHFFDQTDQLDSDYLQALSALRLLMSLVDEFSRQTATLADFVQFIDVTRDTGQVIADESAFVTGDNAVELLTVHKAKGLEFDTVYIIDAIENNWRPTTIGRKAPTNLPLQPAGDDIDDYARLMFVAATRAKRSLIVTSLQADSNNKEVLTSPLVSSALKFTTVPTNQLDKPVAVLEQHLSWPHITITEQQRILHDTLGSFSLSSSSLLDFLDTSQGGPALFFERHLLRLPQATSAKMAFGTAIHAALELAQISTNRQNFTLAKVLDHYQKSLQSQTLPPNELARYLPHGKQLLTKLFKSDTFYLPKGSLAEQTLSDIHVGDATLKGTIDRIDQRKDDIVIVDYKTGKPLSSFTTRATAQQVKAWRHRMQLTFYALLLRGSPRLANKPIVGQMWYVEASSPKELIREFVPTEHDIERMQKLITVIWPKIQKLNLPDITNYSADYSGIIQFEQDLLDGKT